jgi:hypothetical protein
MRFAEAMVGLAREDYIGAKELAMTVLKEGVKTSYLLLKDTTMAWRPVRDTEGNVVYETEKDENGNEVFVYEKDENGDVMLDVNGEAIPKVKQELYLASCADSVRYNFTAQDFSENKGTHSRGCGDSERNAYYALNDTCVARYLGLTEVKDKVETIPRPITADDYKNYIADLVLDELALEFAWEGTRFGDLIRFAEAAKRAGDPNYKDILAMRVAGRAYVNDVTYRNAAYQMDATIYEKMSNEANWYLPLPGEASVVDPVAPDNVPTGELPNK